MLLTAPRHITAEQILGALREGAGHVSKATVYNTLKLFVDQGLVRQIHVDPERCVYDSMMAPHHHFQLLETGEMVDIRPGGPRVCEDAAPAARHGDRGRRGRGPAAPPRLDLPGRGPNPYTSRPSCRSSSVGRAIAS